MSRIVIRLVSGAHKHRKILRMAIIPESNRSPTVTDISDAVILFIEGTILLPGDSITITEED